MFLQIVRDDVESWPSGKCICGWKMQLTRWGEYKQDNRVSTYPVTRQHPLFKADEEIRERKIMLKNV